MTRIFLLAGEASGDRLGAALMRGLRSREPEVKMAGVGGPEMMAEGLSSLFPMSELSVMGLAEVLPRLPRLMARIEEAARAALAFQPDVLVTIDSPDFGLRVAGRVRRANRRIRTVHYVAPSVWAWRAGRARSMARVIDHVLALLPFEPPLMKAAGMGCDFVGHPAVSEPVASPQEVAAFRSCAGGPVVLVLPGSRRGEVARLAPRFGETLARVARIRPELRFVLPVAPGLEDAVAAEVSDWAVPVTLIPPGDPAARRAAFAAADAALAASGTVSLELARNATPMVIGYDAHWLTRAIASRLVRVDTFTLVNLVSETRAVPEFIGRACRPDPMARALLEILAPGPARTAQLEAAEVTMHRLGAGGPDPGLRAAEAVLRVAQASR